MEFEELKKQWNTAKESQSQMAQDPAQMEASIRHNNRFQLNQHIANGLILSVTWMTLLFFYLLIAPMQSGLGRTGALLLLLSLGIRITLEIGSFRYYKRIQPTLATLEKEGKMMKYYLFRKRLHDFWSPVIVLVYLLGIGLQVPEFLQYFSVAQISLWLGLFLASGAFIFWGARRGIRKEMEALRAVIHLKNL